MAKNWVLSRCHLNQNTAEARLERGWGRAGRAGRLGSGQGDGSGHRRTQTAGGQEPLDRYLCPPLVPTIPMILTPNTLGLEINFRSERAT